MDRSAYSVKRPLVFRGSRMAKVSRLVLVLPAVLFWGVLVAQPADAHDVLVSARPGNGSHIASAPAQVELDFDEPVQDGFASVDVIGPGGTHWAAGPPVITGDTVTAPLRPLGPAGDYDIEYRIVSDDGHPVSGHTSFTLTVPGSGAPASAPIEPGSAPAPTSGVPMATATTDHALLVWPWFVAAGAVALIGLVVAGRLVRR